MSVEQMALAFQCTFTPGEFAVAMVLANFADPVGGSVFPSIPLICELAPFADERYVRRILKRFRERGILVATQTDTSNGVVHYQLNLAVAGLKDLSEKALKSIKAGGLQTPPNPVQGGPQTLQGGSTDPSIHQEIHHAALAAATQPDLCGSSSATQDRRTPIPKAVLAVELPQDPLDPQFSLDSGTDPVSPAPTPAKRIGRGWTAHEDTPRYGPHGRRVSA